MPAKAATAALVAKGPRAVSARLPRHGYHATTVRAAQLIIDGGEGIDPAFSERFAHVFIFDTLAATLAFVNNYLENFTDTGPTIFELDLAGLPLEPDPQRPPLPGAWRCAEPIESFRLLAQLELIPHQYPPVISRRIELRVPR
jgi:hypothetical protein